MDGMAYYTQGLGYTSPTSKIERTVATHSSRDLFIPDRWRSPTTIPKRVTFSPSQKGHKRRIARQFLDRLNSGFWFPENRWYIGDIYIYIYNHPIGKDYKWYISGKNCQLWGFYGTYCATHEGLREPGNSWYRSHPLREPGFTPSDCLFRGGFFSLKLSIQFQGPLHRIVRLCSRWRPAEDKEEDFPLEDGQKKTPYVIIRGPNNSIL